MMRSGRRPFPIIPSCLRPISYACLINTSTVFAGAAYAKTICACGKTIFAGDAYAATIELAQPW